MKKTLRWLRFISAAALCVVLLCLMAMILTPGRRSGQFPVIFGYTQAVVLSPSMEPEIKVNDLVVTHRENDYQVDDIVMFAEDGGTVTHRIIAVTEGGYITRGDANPSPDPEIDKSAVIGRVSLVIPKAGKLIRFVRSPAGIFTVAVVAALLLFMPVGKKEKGISNGKKRIR